jgi:hypothetical protein
VKNIDLVNDLEDMLMDREVIVFNSDAPSQEESILEIISVTRQVDALPGRPIMLYCKRRTV